MALNKNSKIVIFGGFGFVGENLVNYFISNGYKNLFLIERNASLNSKKYEIYKDYYDLCTIIDFNFEICNITLIKDYLFDADLILNLIYFKNEKLNIYFNKLILDFCVKFNSVALLFFIGSSLQYKRGFKIISEDSKLVFENSYGIIKNKLEEIYMDYYIKFNLPIIFIKPSNIYGYSRNFMNKSTIDTYIFKNLFLKNKIKFDIENVSYKDFLYIDDFIDAIMILIKNPEKSAGEIFLIGSGIKTEIKEIISIIPFFFPNSKIEYTPIKTSIDQSFSYDISKMKNYFNWESKISFEKGFKKLYDKLTIN